MNKIILSVATIGVVAAIAIGATTAYFSATTTTGTNTFTAGTLDLTSANPGTTLPITVTNVKPGDSGTGTVELKNTGSVDGNLISALFAKTADTDNGCNTPETSAPDATCGTPGEGEGELDSNLEISLWDDANDNGVVDGGENVYGTAGAKLDTLTSAVTPASTIALDSGATKTLKLKWNVPTAVGNIIQSDGTAFTITFNLEQAH